MSEKKIQLKSCNYNISNFAITAIPIIIFLTVMKVLKRSDILVGSEIKVGRLDDARRKD